MNLWRRVVLLLFQAPKEVTGFTSAVVQVSAGHHHTICIDGKERNKLDSKVVRFNDLGFTDERTKEPRSLPIMHDGCLDSVSLKSRYYEPAALRRLQLYYL